MRLVWGLDREVAAYVSGRFPVVAERGGFDPYAAVGIADSNDRLIGGIVVSNFMGHDACLSIYAERPNFLTARMAMELCEWAFRRQPFRRLTAEMAKRNKRGRRFVEGMGFAYEGKKRHGWHDGRDDMCIYGMTFDRCRWLK